LLRVTIICAVPAFLAVLLVNEVSARSRSYPIEVTGTVVTFDRAKQTFIIRVDDPPRVLTLSVGFECKFNCDGALAGEQILKRGARVKVSYFATIFTGHVAVEIDLLNGAIRGGRCSSAKQFGGHDWNFHDLGQADSAK
jgi:hypothetical protein